MPEQQDMPPRVFKTAIALLRLNKRLVCEMSVGRGLHDDFHDYPDGIINDPIHGYEYTCARCGKRFCI